MNKTAQKIIDIAEIAIASKGYSAFSFREIAAELEIKSASVHYHFPTKAHLGLAVARRYRERYAVALELIAEKNRSAEVAIDALVSLYREQIIASQRMSVCMMLAAEINLLPDEIQMETRSFYQLNLTWLVQIIARECEGAEPEVLIRKASQIFSVLQGAWLGAKTQNNAAYFDAAVKAIRPILLG